MTYFGSFDKWDARFVRVAREVAAWSKDPEEGVGAVLVSKDRHQVAWGFNGFPKGIADRPERLQNKELKNEMTIHAELNALLNSPVDVSGWTMYVTKHPCRQCALAIIQRGIARLVTPAINYESRWARNQSEAFALLMEAGLEVVEQPKCD